MVLPGVDEYIRMNESDCLEAIYMFYKVMVAVLQKST
jgi:hypothetical protein